ncbi:T-complex-associated testis-expressed protein 1 [Clonorchis sinensis]|uniref:T-complex-associated testis-expressed protein 1 n=1 Tax=Clonorchis sinensis TaxID=79923 RepID=A0A8T1LZC6_CLOSI|nr:T-complex-associated testis-expressed protein 1 [Clonorchis sinensis]
MDTDIPNRDTVSEGEAFVPTLSRPSLKQEDQNDQTKAGSAVFSSLFADTYAPQQTPRNSKVPKPAEKPSGEGQFVRRIIAEDPTFNLAAVTSLSELCLKRCIENFAYNSSVLAHLDQQQKRRLLDTLPPNMPLKVTAHIIGEDPYWCRCCQEHWKVVDLSRHGGSWKRAFFEKMLEDTIETFVPGHTYTPRLEECVLFAAPYVYRLDIKQLLPPLKQQPKDKNSEDHSDDESDSEQDTLPQKIDHLELGPVLAKLVHLEELAVTYGAKDCGMNFEWSTFQFTSNDCLSLCKALQQHPSIKVLHLTRSRVDSERCRVLTSHLVRHPTLECLDLAHNFIGDRGARALSKLICGQSKIQTLNLADNRLQASGGLSLAHALAKKSCSLVRLNLRLNRLKDDGGIAIAKSLLRNTTLRELNLAANDLEESTGDHFAHVIGYNTALTHLDLSNNQMGPEASQRLLDGMVRNETLLYFDLRFTGSCQEAEYTIYQQIERNQDNLRKRLATQPKAPIEDTDTVIDDMSLPTGVTSVANQHTLTIPTSDPLLSL